MRVSVTILHFVTLPMCPISVYVLQLLAKIKPTLVYLLEDEFPCNCLDDTPNESPLKGPGNFTVAVGSSVSFTCVSPLRDCAGISWNTYVQPSNPVTINIQDRVPRRPDKYIIEDSTEGCNLTVKNVEDKDQGGFFCRIFIGTTTIESTGYLTVTSKLFVYFRLF